MRTSNVEVQGATYTIADALPLFGVMRSERLFLQLNAAINCFADNTTTPRPVQDLRNANDAYEDALAQLLELWQVSPSPTRQPELVAIMAEIRRRHHATKGLDADNPLSTPSTSTSPASEFASEKGENST